MIIEAVETGRAEWKPPSAPATIKEMLDIYDKQSADIVRRWKALPDPRWNGTLDFFGGQRPAAPMAWSFLFDIVHHRGQITTYLRPHGIDGAADLRTKRGTSPSRAVGLGVRQLAKAYYPLALAKLSSPGATGSLPME